MPVRLISVRIRGRAALAGRLLFVSAARWGFRLGGDFPLSIVALVPAVSLEDKVRGGDEALN